MHTSDTSEKGLESLICSSLVKNSGYFLGQSHDYDKDHAVDLNKLLIFLKNSQPTVFSKLALGTDGPSRLKFLTRLQNEIAKKGVVEVLRRGIKHGATSIDLFYGVPSSGNPKAIKRFESNLFSVTRQLHYSKIDNKKSLDLVLFINGLPVATFELKNNLTKQTVADAVQQYKNDRNQRELLFQFGRCLVHFALDENEARFCTKLEGVDSWFLPFNKGYKDGAGNPPNPNGIKTDYLWNKKLEPKALSNIIENYAQILYKKDETSGRRKKVQIFPRFHQLDVVEKLLQNVTSNGVGRRYLIQHSAGSGKSNSIAWLAYQLVGLEKEKSSTFDSIIVVTDRKVLDKQIRDTIKQFAQVSAVVGAVTEGSGQLKRFLESGKKIIITTVQKFPYILDEIGNEHRQRTFAIIIDEAHSSQGCRTSAKMNIVLSSKQSHDDETIEDVINRIMDSRKMLSNASYFAFTATPKNKTLELFGDSYKEGNEVKHRPFHTYTMKQAIQEGLILDVLQNYTTIDSYYRLRKKIEDDPEFDTKKARKKLRHYVESHELSIQRKTEIMLDHFHKKVIYKIGGQARAMVVTNSVKNAIQYFFSFQEYLKTKKSRYCVIVAFSGEHEYCGKKVTESSLNHFSTKLIPEKIRQDPYRFLICAEKFQTGYDEPLLHTMYVDKHLSGIKAVQTLSRLNRSHPKKHDTFILDFQNTSDTIQTAFNDYYRTTILSDETDPNKLHDLKFDLDGYQIYNSEAVNTFVVRYLIGSERTQLDPILDVCVEGYLNNLTADEKIDFKGKAKAFVRIYNFLASILPFNNKDWEKLSIFLNFLIPKLPAPKENDLSRGILETIDMESYRLEIRPEISITLDDRESEIDCIPTSSDSQHNEPKVDKLSNILREFNQHFGHINWKNKEKICKVISEEIPARVAADRAYQNAMRNSDKQNARIEHDSALQRVLANLLMDHTELFKQYSDNLVFRKWLADTSFISTYSPESI